MSEKTTEDAEPIGTTDAEDAELLLADPEDYHQAQRLREIHDARQRVHTVLENISRYTNHKDHKRQEMKLADVLTGYITELEPIIEQADLDADLPDKLPWSNLQAYATAMGAKPTEDDATMASYNESMLVFRRCNKILAEVKPLLTEDETNEWEV